MFLMQGNQTPPRNEDVGIGLGIQGCGPFNKSPGVEPAKNTSLIPFGPWRLQWDAFTHRTCGRSRFAYQESLWQGGMALLNETDWKLSLLRLHSTDACTLATRSRRRSWKSPLDKARAIENQRICDEEQLLRTECALLVWASIIEGARKDPTHWSRWGVEAHPGCTHELTLHSSCGTLSSSSYHCSALISYVQVQSSPKAPLCVLPVFPSFIFHMGGASSWLLRRPSILSSKPRLLSLT